MHVPRSSRRGQSRDVKVLFCSLTFDFPQPLHRSSGSRIPSHGLSHVRTPSHDPNKRQNLKKPSATGGGNLSDPDFELDCADEDDDEDENEDGENEDEEGDEDEDLARKGMTDKELGDLYELEVSTFYY